MIMPRSVGATPMLEQPEGRVRSIDLSVLLSDPDVVRGIEQGHAEFLSVYQPKPLTREDVTELVWESVIELALQEEISTQDILQTIGFVLGALDKSVSFVGMVGQGQEGSQCSR